MYKTYEDVHNRNDLSTLFTINVFFLLEKFVALIIMAWFQVCIHSAIVIVCWTTARGDARCDNNCYRIFQDGGGSKRWIDKVPNIHFRYDTTIYNIGYQM